MRQLAIMRIKDDKRVCGHGDPCQQTNPNAQSPGKWGSLLYGLTERALLRICRFAAGALGFSLMRTYGANLLFAVPLLITLKVRCPLNVWTATFDLRNADCTAR